MFQLKFYSRILAFLIVIISIYFIGLEIGSQTYKEPPSIKFEAIEITTKNEEIPTQIKSEPIENKSISKNYEKPEYIPKYNDNLENIKIIPQKGNVSIKDVIKNSNPEANNLPKGPVENNSFDQGEKEKGLKEKSQKALFAMDCLKLDINERPKNCPPNNNAKKMIEFENGPKYRPEKVVGFTNSEIKAKKAAGWRDKCEKNEGGQYQVCMAVGKKPPRVKTPYELCIESGLGGCKRPKTPNGQKSELGFE